MKYLDKTFSIGGYGKMYSDNWETTFGYRVAMKQLSDFMGMVAKILTVQEQQLLDRSTRR